MIKVFGVGRGGNKKTATDDVANQEGSGSKPGEIRMQKELDELDTPAQCRLSFPTPSNIMIFVLDVRPEEGYWKNATYRFTFTIPDLYPHEAPKVKCDTRIFHPNIDLEGNVCLNILREEWKPVLSISAVIYGILHLFSEPNPNDPLNQQAAQLLRDDKSEFSRVVQRTLKGASISGVEFPRLL